MEKHYRAIIENINAGIFIFDKNGIIKDVNKKIEKIIKCEREELINNDFRKFIPPNDLAYATVQHQKLLREKQIGPNIIIIKQCDGGVTEVEFSAAYVDENNESFFLATMNEIEDRNRINAKKQLSEKLAIVSNFAAGFIHEINNPMTWILTNLSYIKEKIKLITIADTPQKTLLTKLDNVIDESIQGAERIQNIAQGLKKFIRVENEQTVLVNVHEEISSAIEMAKSIYSNTSPIETLFDKHVPLVLLATGRLKQVFFNLISNAINSLDPSNPQNKIMISTHVNADKVLIDTTDTGVGISDEALPKIFEPFYSANPKGIGTGLGLSICSEIIHKVGGEIKVIKTSPEGTTFRVELPIQLKIMNEASLTPSAKLLSRKKILVVDDEPTLLTVIKRILEKTHEIITCDGRTAIDLLAKKDFNFDCIITDFNMPNVSGIDIYRYVSKFFPGKEKYIIFTTGGKDTEQAKTFLEEVKNICLEKPFTPEQLRDALNQTFSAV